MRKNLSILGFLILAPFVLALAQQEAKAHPLHRTEVFFGLGSTAESGYLFNGGVAAGYAEVGARLWTEYPTEEGSRASFWEFQFGGTVPQKTVGNYFPLSAGTSVNPGWVAFIPNWSFLRNPDWSVYFGVGPALFDLSDSNYGNSQSYGTFAWQAGAIYQLDAHWNLGFRAQYLKLSQSVAGSSSFEEFFTSTLHLGYAPDWANH